jgi:hypothetical protein
MVSTAAGQFRLILDALEIQAFRQILAMPQITLPVAGVAYNVNASLGHDGISRCGRGSGRRAGPTVHLAGRSAPSARRPGGGPTLADRVPERAECTVTVTGAPGQPVTLTTVAATAAGPVVQRWTAAKHGTRFDDLRVLRSPPTLPRRFSEAVITPPGSLGGAGVAGTLSTIPTIMT